VTGLTIEVEHVVAVIERFFKEKGLQTLFITFKAKMIDGEISIQDQEEISEIQWIDIQRANEWMPYHSSGVEGLLRSLAPYTFQK
jgi:8-oxo-dGTP diphosphatase